MDKLRLVIPKGSPQRSVVELLGEAGICLSVSDRDYRPMVSDESIVAKIMRPQNIPKLIEMGSHDVGFTGHDWVHETDADVVEVLDLGFDPVKIVAAVPKELKVEELKKRRIIVATEYEAIAKGWLDSQGYDYVLLRTYGATEAFPPDDADMIIDNTATGRTMKEHGLDIIATIMGSSTCVIANKEAMNDPFKKRKIEELRMLFKAVVDARGRVLLEMNVPRDRFDAMVKGLPCMRSPTVAPLFGEDGFAVKIAVKKEEVPRLIPRLKELGATDILEYDIGKVVP